MERTLDAVIEQLLDVISSAPTHNSQLIARLEDTLTSVRFAAPEMLNFWWHETASILNDEIPNPTADWELELVDIFSGTSNPPENLDK